MRSMRLFRLVLSFLALVSGCILLSFLSGLSQRSIDQETKTGACPKDDSNLTLPPWLLRNRLR